MDIHAEIDQLLKEIGPGQMSDTAYDTSWVARLLEDSTLSNNALLWLSENQLADGSWGAPEPFYYHDRIISTLAAMIALTYRGRRIHDRTQIEKGQQALELITTGATSGLASDPNGSTAGFEMIVPTLVTEAERIGLIKQQGDRILGRLGRLRNSKMEKLLGRKINREISAAFSTEMAGEDWRKLLDVDNLQEQDGSVSHSPSATAYFLQQIKPNEPRAMEYLCSHASPSGGFPDFAPIDIFEVSWSLWNLKLSESFSIHTAKAKGKIDLLYKAWNPHLGIGTASNSSIKDSDDSSVVFEVLKYFGYPVDIEAILSFEEPTHFRCFSYEANPSISANIHVLGALNACGFGKSDRNVTKVLTFLKKNMQASPFWYDKWHSSPYYATSHLIIGCAEYDHEICANSARWIFEQQRADGSWGGHRNPTAEETAYCLQALLIWEQHGGRLPAGRVEMAANWLKNHRNDAYPPLWIGKALYTPHRVVKSAILSALLLAESR